MLNLVPDFEDSTGHLDYIHRADATTDIYFVRNTTSRTVDALARFRVTGRTPEIWNAVDGTIKTEMHYNVEKEQTRLPLHLNPYASAFIVFARPAGLHVTQILKDGSPLESASVSGDDRSGFTLQLPDAGYVPVGSFPTAAS